MKSKIDKRNSRLRLVVRDERTGKIDFAASELTLKLVDKPGKEQAHAKSRSNSDRD